MSRIQRLTNPLFYTPPSPQEQRDYRQQQLDMDTYLGQPTMETYRRDDTLLPLDTVFCPRCGDVVEDLGTHCDFECCEE